MRRVFLVMVIASCPAIRTQAQVSDLLSLQSIRFTSGGPVQFTFLDQGTGSTNYQAQFSSRVGSDATWQVDNTAVITALGGGSYRVDLANPQAPVQFYRVVGYGPSGGNVLVDFSTTAFQVEEGQSTNLVLTLNQPFHGTIYYSVGGTATTGDYQPLTGQVMVNGTTATIPVDLTDNNQIGRLKYLTLRLEDGAGYQLSNQREATLTIDENDADWQGSFMTDGAAVGFVLSIRSLGGTTTATLRSEGFGFFPTNDIPASVQFTADRFDASVSGIPVAADATLLNQPMNLSLVLSAMNGAPNESVTPTQVEGAGVLISDVPAKPFLSTTNQGTFLLFKPPVAPSTNEVQLTSAP